jgi:predicted transcriptional regulator
MQRSLDSYGTQKSTSITCARRLKDLLGDDIVKGSSLNVSFIISKKPLGKSVAERAIPSQIFEL